jgi:cytochrome c553
MLPRGTTWLVGALLHLLPLGNVCPAAQAADATPEGIEFFEKKVRPVLVAHCYPCHSADAKKLRGHLLLDNRAGLLKGGESGPVVVPGQPEDSRLIKAVGYQDDVLRMPPRGKLADEHIADLTAWVKMGAPWPDTAGSRTVSAKAAFDLQERRKHWCFQPVQNHAPPAVKRADWLRSPIDSFVLAQLESKGLAPALPADKRTLLRRVTYDLIGLPPAPAEIDAFLADDSPDAFEKVVDRLLASPQYGERWGRHWLDLVRFAETAGHEFDMEMPEAYQYRDYVIRALNADVPYDRFVIEHVAGDLLAEPRRHPTERFNESILGTGFWFLGESKHSPVDVRADEADRMDNQIDVFSKAFLGLTLSCARCHDHKFDAISTKDYYALLGYLLSSRQDRAFLDDLGPVQEKVRQLQEIRAERRKLPPVLEKHLSDQIEPQVSWSIHQMRYLRKDKKKLEKFEEGKQILVQEMNATLAEAAEKLRNAIVFADFSKGSWKEWFVSGTAFGQGPSQAGDGTMTGPLLPSGWAHSGALSPKLEGVLRSPTFLISKKYVHLHLGGKKARVNLVLAGLQQIRDPIYGGLTFKLSDSWNGELGWRTQDVSMWIGQRAYIEIIDDGDAVVAVDQVLFSDDPPPPPLPSRTLLRILENPKTRSWEDLEHGLRQVFQESLKQWIGGTLAAQPDANDRVDLLNDLYEGARSLSEEQASDPAVKAYNQEIAKYQEIEATIKPSRRGLTMADGSAVNEYVFIRGNHKNLGEEVPRRFLEAIAGPSQPAPARGSGRLELAQRLVDSSNPLLPRVLVNRLWKHHFGEGLVRSVDNFGVLGEEPSHLELLDYLARELVRRGWSIKSMHRLLVLSSTYQMASRAEAAADEADPRNRLLHRMPIRRLEAECIRDAVLAASGRLDRRMFGPGVLPHLTPFMAGRGKPTHTGPLDGAGRRSVYLNVRRNFLTPLFLAFDYPIPFTTIGRRSVSNVPAQALALMNNPFVVQQAELWAKRALAEPGLTPRQRVTNLYVTAFGRPPTDAELAEALAFLEEQGKQYGRAEDVRAWSDLCHVLYNVKEFIFID